MSARKVLAWPPVVGQRVCLDLGDRLHGSWSGEVRAIVDDDFAVVKRWRAHKGWYVYEILDRLTVEVWNERGREPRVFVGGLRRRRA